MAGNRDARRERLALELARGLTVEEAAGEVGVSLRTAYNWRTEPEFTARVKELRAEMFAQAVAKLAAVNGKAADTLAGLLDNADAKVALAAAKAVLELGRSLRQTEDLADEVARLRRMVEEVQRGDGDPAPGSGPTPGGGPGANGVGVPPAAPAERGPLPDPDERGDPPRPLAAVAPPLF
jgi:hypothetical protein